MENVSLPRLQSRPQNKFDARDSHIHAMGSNRPQNAGVVFPRLGTPARTRSTVVANFIEWQADANPMQREDSWQLLANQSSGALSRAVNTA